jgi:hypothetical protein
VTTLFDELAALQQVFPGAVLLDVPGRTLVRVPSVTMHSPWSPPEVAALLVCDNWPAQRPRLLISQILRHNGQTPPNFAPELVADEAWYGYSFNAPWDPAHPSLVSGTMAWLRRFDGRP